MFFCTKIRIFEIRGVDKGSPVLLWYGTLKINVAPNNHKLKSFFILCYVISYYAANIMYFFFFRFLNNN